jgi:SAM-dependent methyltransferase
MNIKQIEKQLGRWFFSKKESFWHPEHLTRKPSYDLLANFVKKIPQNVVLDIGCGKKPYKHLFRKDVDYIGLDFATTKEDYDSTNETHVDIYADASKEIPLLPQSVDIVLLTHTLEHLENPEHAMKEINRVLCPNGIVIIMNPFIEFEHGSPHDYTRYTLPGLIALLKRHNFDIIEYQTICKLFSTFATTFNKFLIYDLVLFNKNKVARIMLLPLLPLLFAWVTLNNIFGKLLDYIIPNNKYSEIFVVGRRKKCVQQKC